MSRPSKPKVCFFTPEQKSSSVQKLQATLAQHFKTATAEAALEDDNIAIIQFANTLLPEEIILTASKHGQLYRENPLVVIGPGLTFEQRFQLFFRGVDEYLNFYCEEQYIISKIRDTIKKHHRKKLNLMHYSKPLKELMQLQYADLTLNLLTHEVSKNGVPLRLRRKEFDLLKFFMEQPEQTFTIEELLDKVWGYSYETVTNTVQSHISSLRKKLKLGKNVIHTFPKHGYILSENLAGWPAN